jgi:predicted CoA-substrate-specific enzyme activase
MLRAGVDIGSTTVKLVITDKHNKMLYSGYQRHNTRIRETLKNMLTDASIMLGEVDFTIAFTGSGGMGLSESLELPFVQELVASTEVIRTCYPEVKTLIDLGGEDAKMIFFEKGKSPDIRMNGSCAGGTGAFIDQMAALMNLGVEKLDSLAANSEKVYPIASRCGVFAKTDVQNLISRKVSNEDISSSIFHAVALQTINSLARGYDRVSPVLFCGGPLTFIGSLRMAFMDLLKLTDQEIIIPENGELLPAMGAAIYSSTTNIVINIDELIELTITRFGNNVTKKGRLEPLFKNSNALTEWTEGRTIKKIKKFDISQYNGEDCFLGIDSGSTTTKVIVIDNGGRLMHHFYANNNGNPLETALKGLVEFREKAKEFGKFPNITSSAVTGYGEDLIKAALNIDFGIVETMAHFMAARHMDDKVSFILDIGGQDMKAIFIENGFISQIEINEACSSGCGSFVEGFARSLGYTASEFAQLACKATDPCDLGTRCTVFMNSKVKQSLKEGAESGDIAAGLAYSVIKNCLFKVLKLNDMNRLGNHIVAQGGSFRNPSILRALEKFTGKSVVCSDFPELMGAYGAALYARNMYIESMFTSGCAGLINLEKAVLYDSKNITCKGCTNICSITRFSFSNGNVQYAGNKCEKIFHSKGSAYKKGQNVFEHKNRLLFERDSKLQAVPVTKIGIPRILNMFDNYPFWHTLLAESGFKVVSSSESDMNVYRKGAGSVMSDNICFPAKLAHGHVIDLVEKKVDRILFPMVVLERKEFENAANTFNCPVVTGYADVLKSSIDTQTKYNIPFDAPVVVFNDNTLLEKSCWDYLKSLGVSKSVFKESFKKALIAQIDFKKEWQSLQKDILDNAIKNNRLVVVLASHPYHADPLIHQKVSHMLSDMDVDVVSEEVFTNYEKGGFTDVFCIPQWAYPNRVLNTGEAVAALPKNVQLVQLNSFGCGPDSFIIDEIADALKKGGKNATLIRIDEISSPGSIRLRLRSLVESLKVNNVEVDKIEKKKEKTIFDLKDKNRIILAPWFADFYSPFMPTLAGVAGYNMINLPPPDRQSVELGMKYANNEVCYPATLVIGDLIKALQSGKYDINNVAVAISQTGGQCRATNYLSLLKRALQKAGYSNVPVVSVASNDGMINEQPGFQLNWKKLVKITFVSLLFADAISQMYYAVVTREKEKGACRKLKDKYLESVQLYVAQRDVKGVLALLEKAVKDFNNVEVNNCSYPKMGVVGEIYVKYNACGHYHILDWLIDQGIEVCVPPLLDFMIQSFVNNKVNKQKHVVKPQITDILSSVFEIAVDYYLKRTNKILSGFKYYRHHLSIHQKAVYASEILDLTNQFGEGWLIPAEISAFAREDVNHVISLQPFGCIANHIVAKGVEKKIKAIYPNMNLLFLDFDADTSEVNVLNRLYFMMRSAREAVGIIDENPIYVEVLDEV